MRSKKPWNEKLNPPGLPQIVQTRPDQRKTCGPTMVLPSPAEVVEKIRAIPKGSVKTVSQIREELAKDHGTTSACPLMTGIFTRMIAEASEEDGNIATGAPYWRVVLPKGRLNPKFPGGAEAQAARLRAEGLSIGAGFKIG